MPTPYRTDGAWLPQAAVLAQLGIGDPLQQPQAADADRARLWAASYVERVRPDLQTVVVTAEAVSVTFAPTPEVIGGAVLLAARLYARKGSPQGLASFGEFGPSAVLRLDPDVERLLGVGRHSRPMVG